MLPSTDSLLQQVRQSCTACTASSAIALNDSHIDSFLTELQPRDAQDGLRLPLQFDSVDDELNLFALIGILNFLSGYRQPLHRLTGRGAHSTILSLVLSAYLTLPALDAEWMRSTTPARLADLANIKTHREEDHPTLGSAVKVGIKDEEAFEVLELLAGVLNESGVVLERLGAESLGVWLRGVLRRAHGNGAAVVHELADTFPAFRDAHQIDGQDVYLFKKAFWLVSQLAIRYADDAEVPFKAPSTAGFPVFADNVLPTMLLHYGILDLGSSTDPALRQIDLANQLSLTLSCESATRLRAAAVCACSVIVQRAHKAATTRPDSAWLASLTEPQLDSWIWNEAKREGLRDVERMAERQTVYY